MSLSVDLPSTFSVPLREPFSCPYCDAMINGHAVSCRCCGRDLTPVLPLLRRLDDLEGRLAAIEKREEARLLALPAPSTLTAAPAETSVLKMPATLPIGRRRVWALALGFLTLMAAYWTLIIWLDLALTVLRFASIAIPLAMGMVYLGPRPRLTWFDTSVAVLFALVSVGSMNALLGWTDSMPMLPQGTAAWRETFFYALSIGASLFCGMLLRVTQVALSSRGLTSLPRLRDSVMAANSKVPMDTLKAIELTILLVSTIISAITGLVAGLLGLTR